MQKTSRLVSSSAVAVLIASVLVGACTLGSEAPSASFESPSVPTPSVTPSTPATPSPTAVASSPSALPVSADLDPVDGTVLQIAGRDGAPGVISCKGLGGRFTYATISRPTGAEDEPGPEFDVLRATIARYGDDSEFATLKSATSWGEMERDASSVVFFGDLGNREGPFAIVKASFDGAAWKWAGMGDCRLIGEPGEGWGAANWVLDPAFDRPTSDKRKLHLLVSEADCNPSVPIVGRLAPAFVFFEPNKVRIQLFVRTVEPPGSCAGIGPTDLGTQVAVSLLLPEPLGARKLKDSTPEPCRGCGG